jgi:hypothetical protein
VKEFSDTFVEAFVQGLRESAQNSRNSHRFVELYNIYPTKAGPRIHEPVIMIHESGYDWAGQGTYTPTTATRTITVHVVDYADLDDLSGVAVTLDGVSKGSTDASGELEIADVETGGHLLVLTKAGYDASGSDVIANDFLLVI